jgi:hypothetical protein
MFGGQARVPMVIRQPSGMWRSSAAQHSQSLEAWYTHIPGLVVTAPYTPADNKGLLKAAIRCDDPVIYIEHKDNWDLTGEVPDEADFLVPLGAGRIAHPSADLTLVTWSKMVGVAERAAQMALAKGIGIEVIDLRTLWPWDQDMVLPRWKRPGACWWSTRRCGWEALAPRSRPPWPNIWRTYCGRQFAVSAPPGRPYPMPNRWKICCASRRKKFSPRRCRKWIHRATNRWYALGHYRKTVP